MNQTVVRACLVPVCALAAQRGSADIGSSAERKSAADVVAQAAPVMEQVRLQENLRWTPNAWTGGSYFWLPDPYVDFVAAYNDDRASADFNKDGETDFFDYLDFVYLSSVGC